MSAWLSALALGAALLLTTSPTPASAAPADDARKPPAFPQFPQTGAENDLQRWIVKNTSVSPAEIVVVTPQALISILAPYAREGSTVKVHIREEALSQALAEQLGGRSATAIATVQCPTGGVSIGAVEVYPGNNLSGGQAKSVSAFAWMAANESVEPGKIAQKACGGGARSAASDSMNGTGRDNATPPGSPPPSRPAVIEAGARWAQIGAFASPELAQSSWAKLQKRWPTATQSLSERTQLVTVRGASVHRSLVGPFPSLSSARAFCGMLIAQGADCLVR